MRYSSWLMLIGVAGVATTASAQMPSREVRSILERVAVDADAKGYRHPRGDREMIPALAGGTPRVNAPRGATFAEGQVRLRDCSKDERRRYHPCVRADVVSMLAYDSTDARVALSVIPQSFLGDSLGDAMEVTTSPEVLADAASLARPYGGFVLRAPMPASENSSASATGPSAIGARHLSSDAALGLARIEAASHGYRMGGEPARLLQSFLAMGPSPAVTGMEGLSPMLLERECTSDQAASHPHCVRVEWLEIFYGPVPFTQDEQVGVIPHTYVGTGPRDLSEVEADSEVAAVATAVAARAEGRVVRAIFWQTPVSTPGGH